jgi:hypothetical protein
MVYYFFPKLKNMFFGDGDSHNFCDLICIFSGGQIEARFIPYQNMVI